MAKKTNTTGQYASGTNIIYGQEEAAKQIKQIKNESAKAKCIAQGGRWDEATQTCDLSKAVPYAPNELQTANKNVQQPQIQEIPKANIPKGNIEYAPITNEPNKFAVTNSEGNMFFGLNKEDLNKFAGQQEQKYATPQNAAPMGTAQNTLDTQVRNQQLMQMAQQGLLTPQELQAVQGANIDVGQAVGAGGIGVLPGVLGGLGTAAGATLLGAAASGGMAGLTAGSFLGPGALVTAGLGAVAGFLFAMRSNIKSQQSEEFAADKLALTTGQKYLRGLITDTNKNPQNAPENIALFYQTLNMIDAAHAKTWKDSQEDLNKFLGNDGTTELARFETFDNTMRQYYIQQFQTALAAPNPNQILITAEDLGVETEE